MINTPLHKYASVACDVLSPEAYAYIVGGAGREGCIARNEGGWSEILLSPEPMQDMTGLSSAISIQGTKVDFPCFVAPMAFQKLAHPEGERAMAVGAASQGAGFVLSCQTSVAPVEVAAGPFWFQLYLQNDPVATVSLVQTAIASGASALIVTIDAPVNGIRNREQEAGFVLPEGIRPVLMDGLPIPAKPTDPVVSRGQTAPVWDDLARLCRHSPIPVFGKGVMSVETGKRALDAGCAGLIVSNHGGRVLDGLPATASVLPSIRRAFAEATLLVDGGIRCGEDMFRAIALGADAVLVGRPVYFALALDGARGVATCLRRMRDEFLATMILCGTPTVADITADHLYRNA